MDDNLSEDSDSADWPLVGGTRKRRRLGRVRDADKVLRATTHELGPDCRCKRFKCFEQVNEGERLELISKFNAFGDRNKQNSFLAGFITVNPIKQRRLRKPEEEATLHNYSYEYKVRVLRAENIEEVKICSKAFISFFGITSRRVQTIKEALTTTGAPPIDKRGTHKNRPNKIPEETKTLMMEFFNSLKGRKAHYSLKDNNRVYLPEHLNVKKLLQMFMEKHSDKNVAFSLEVFREVFVNNFNIHFGYPRTDTCAFCDEMKVREESIETSLQNAAGEQKIALQNELTSLQTKITVHKMKADTFYKRKKQARKDSRKHANVEAICFDYGRNLDLPDISTSEVYFRRQLSFYLFNVHVLSNNQVVFYTYDQTEGKKGADAVVSMLNDFIENRLDKSVEELRLFCDSCSGQNKNFTMFRYLHYITTVKKRFTTVTVTFPIRGHSYMEPDKDMGLIPRKTGCEMPEEMREVIRSARAKPSPFEVVSFGRTEFKKWGDSLSQVYKNKFKGKTRPIREVRFTQNKTRTMEHRDSYNGAFLSTEIKGLATSKTKSKTRKVSSKNNVRRQPSTSSDATEPPNLTVLPELLMCHPNPIPLTKENYKDLQVLKRFCKQEANDFYSNLPHKLDGAAAEGNDSDEDYL